MKKILIPISVMFTVLGCNNRQDQLRTQILENLAQFNGKIKLQDLTSLSWNKFYIVGPYSQKEMFDDTLATQTDLIERIGISSRDDILLLLFFNQKKLAGYAEIKLADLNSTVSPGRPVKFYQPHQVMMYDKNPIKGYTITGIGSKN